MPAGTADVYEIIALSPLRTERGVEANTVNWESCVHPDHPCGPLRKESIMLGSATLDVIFGLVFVFYALPSSVRARWSGSLPG